MALVIAPASLTPLASSPLATTTNTSENPLLDNPAGRKGPGGKHDNMRTFSPEEQQIVFRLVEAHLPRWTHIAKLVSEATGQQRTAASIRNYYKRFQASKAIAERDSAIRKLNRCQVCGQIKRGHICKPQPALTYAGPPANTKAERKTKITAAKVEEDREDDEDEDEDEDEMAVDESARGPTPPPAAAAASAAASILNMPFKTAGGLVLAAGADGESVPPLAPASLEHVFHVPSGSPALSTPGPLSLSAFSMLGSPTALAALGLQLGTPAGSLGQMNLGSLSAAAHFPFARSVTQSAVPEEAAMQPAAAPPDERAQDEEEDATEAGNAPSRASPVAEAEVARISDGAE